MRYTSEEFFRLMGEIQDQGGQHLDETHTPAYVTKWSGPKPIPATEVSYCDENALFEIGYLPGGREVPSDPIKVCAVDDCMGLWPRYNGADAKGSGHLFMTVPRK